MKKATKQQVLEMAVKQEEKYVELVWFARSGRNLHIPAVVIQRERIEGMYPEEVKHIQGESGDWAHGFNSGMLAGMRLITSMMEIDVEHAEENFPELDS
jgi:hypothetical protein